MIPYSHSFFTARTPEVWDFEGGSPLSMQIHAQKYNTNNNGIRRGCIFCGRREGKRKGKGREERRACVFVYEYESADQMGDMSTNIKGTVSRVASALLDLESKQLTHGLTPKACPDRLRTG